MVCRCGREAMLGEVPAVELFNRTLNARLPGSRLGGVAANALGFSTTAAEVILCT
jgi:hypothetical protein